ncbi:MAG: hypothetical protein WC915_01695 [archaeon]|jgi:hypothetical protein
MDFKNIKSFISQVVLANALRLFRVFPNNDPIMGFMLPQARKSMFKAAIFAFSTMFIFDIITMKVGVWTIVTASTYALLAIGFSFFFKKIKIAKISHYLSASVIGILLFDLITGPIMSSMMFSQTLMLTILGQIPFTFYHLVSGITWVVIIAPVYDLDIRAQYSSYKNQILVQIKYISSFLRLF